MEGFRQAHADDPDNSENGVGNPYGPMGRSWFRSIDGLMTSGVHQAPNRLVAEWVNGHLPLIEGALRPHTELPVRVCIG